MNINNLIHSSGNPDAFLELILANQSPNRQSVAKAMGNVLSVYLPTAYDEKLNDQIDYLVDSIAFELGGQPGVAPPEEQIRGGRVLLVTGEAGAGKTRALAHSFRNRPEFPGFGRPGQWCPLLSVVAPSPFTLAALGNEIARKLGYEGTRDIKHSKVWPFIRELMKECGVRILHIDEAQHVDEIVNAATSQDADNTLKRMMQEVEWPIWLILSGLPEIGGFCQDDNSMVRRVRIVEFEPLRFPDHIDTAREVMRSIVDLCPSLRYSQVQTDEFLHRLLHASMYQFGILVEYVQDAIGECLSAGESELVIGHFADVYTLRTGETDDTQNVFLARDWLSISVQTALYEDVLSAAGNPTGARNLKMRRTRRITS